MNLQKKDSKFSFVLAYKDIVNYLPLEMALAREDLGSRFTYCSYMINNDTGILSAVDEFEGRKACWAFRPEMRRWEKVFDTI